MSTTTIEVHELPSRFEEIISLAAAGAEVIVMEGNIPRVRLIPLPLGRARIPGLHPGAIEMSEDFAAPLSKEFWMGEL